MSLKQGDFKGDSVPLDHAVRHKLIFEYGETNEEKFFQVDGRILARIPSFYII